MNRFSRFGQKIKTLLAAGGIGVILTDTIYGIVGSARSRQAVERIYRLKRRENNKPFIVLIADRKDLAWFGVALKPEQEKALRSYWPGPVSVIVPVSTKRLSYLHRGGGTIAFRLPASPKLRHWLRATGPLVAPSANPAGETPARTIADAEAYFGDLVDFYIDGGSRQGKPSKVVRMHADGTIEVLRK